MKILVIGGPGLRVHKDAAYVFEKNPDGSDRREPPEKRGGPPGKSFRARTHVPDCSRRKRPAFDCDCPEIMTDAREFTFVNFFQGPHVPKGHLHGERRGNVGDRFLADHVGKSADEYWWSPADFVNKSIATIQDGLPNCCEACIAIARAADAKEPAAAAPAVAEAKPEEPETK